MAVADQSTRCIFLVDDEPIQNEMLKDYLSERFGYTIKTYESGEDAIRDLNSLNPAIMVLDFHLNSHLPTAKNGVEVLKEVKAINPGTQVIMLSGQDKLQVAVDSMKHGAYDYVIKGETAFSRMENIFNNLNELSGLKESNKTFKKIISFLGVIVMVVVVFAVFLTYKLRSYSGI
jgi:two-component system OmpR family response regulator